MSNRSATETIKGYFYQFDYSINKLLNLTNEADEITVEGIEDVDIETIDDSTAVQCKYYSKQEYNHSLIAKPIRAMLSHFKELKEKRKLFIKYHLYGFYRSGQHKLALPLTLDFLKEKLLTYKSNKITYKHHETLTLDDLDLTQFINLLEVDINAKDYDAQRGIIISTLQSVFSCSIFYAEYGLYNSALNEIRKLSINDNIDSRKITKKEFLKRIDQKECLFNTWFLELKGKRKYYKEMKEKYFKSVLNRDPIERLFIIEPPVNTSISDLTDIVSIISKKYSNLKDREPNNYCPYIYFHQLPEQDLVKLKQQLHNEEFNFIDGYTFKGSSFSANAISKPATSENMIILKLLSDKSDILDTFKFITKRKEFYQFYVSNRMLLLEDEVKTVNIQIQELSSIKEII